MQPQFPKMIFYISKKQVNFHQQMWNQLCQSKICEQLDLKKFQNKIFSNISQVKPEVNCQEPFLPSFFKAVELKHRKRDRQQGLKISYENQLLRDKMMNIDSRKYSAFSDQLDSFRASHATSKIQNRIRQANQINHENLGIQKRLVSTTSMYSVKQFELDNMKRKYLANNISHNARRVGQQPDQSISQLNKSTKSRLSKFSLNSPQEVNYDYGILENSLAQRRFKTKGGKFLLSSSSSFTMKHQKSFCRQNS
ncbi:hypothetical protein ABPG72_000963 [Tetrahymena utriculariae]